MVKGGENMRLDRVKVFGEAMRQEMNCIQLASKAGVSRSTVYGIKSGRSCSSETADKIAQALGVTVDSLKVM